MRASRFVPGSLRSHAPGLRIASVPGTGRSSLRNTPSRPFTVPCVQNGRIPCGTFRFGPEDSSPDRMGDRDLDERRSGPGDPPIYGFLFPQEKGPGRSSPDRKRPESPSLAKNPFRAGRLALSGRPMAGRLPDGGGRRLFHGSGIPGDACPFRSGDGSRVVLLPDPDSGHFRRHPPESPKRNRNAHFFLGESRCEKIVWPH